MTEDGYGWQRQANVNGVDALYYLFGGKTIDAKDLSMDSQE